MKIFTDTQTVKTQIDGFRGLPGKDGRDGKDGKDGRDGIDGVNGRDGKDGYTPQKGVDYFDGRDGRDGADGKSGVQMSGNEPTDPDVNVWIIPDGEPDADPGGGLPGEDGGYYMPSVDGAGNLSWTGSKAGMPDIPGANIKGGRGDKGDKGDAPQKGVDYWTAADREQIVSDVLAALPNASGVSF